MSIVDWNVNFCNGCGKDIGLVPHSISTFCFCESCEEKDDQLSDRDDNSMDNLVMLCH